MSSRPYCAAPQISLVLNTEPPEPQYPDFLKPSLWRIFGIIVLRRNYKRGNSSLSLRQNDAGQSGAPLEATSSVKMNL
jgi:hypothetical protein